MLMGWEEMRVPEKGMMKGRGVEERPLFSPPAFDEVARCNLSDVALAWNWSLKQASFNRISIGDMVAPILDSGPM